MLKKQYIISFFIAWIVWSGLMLAFTAYTQELTPNDYIVWIAAGALFAMIITLLNYLAAKRREKKDTLG